MTFVLHRQVLDNLSDGVTVQDRDFRIVYQNQAMKDAFGEHVGETCYAIYEKRDEICEGCGVRRAFETGEANLVLRTAYEKDGTTSYWENACFPIFDNDGHTIAGVEICRNVSGRVSLEAEVKDRNIELGQLNRRLKQQAEELTSALRQREAAERDLVRIKTAVDASSDAIGLATAEGRHFYQNEAFTRMFGYPVEAFADMHPRVLFADPSVAVDVFDTIMGGGSWTGETDAIARDGRRFPVSLRANAVKDDAGKVIGLVGAFTDITERRRSEVRSRHAQKLEAIGQLAAGIAHEINTPIQYIGDNTRFLQEGFATLAKVCQSVGGLLDAAPGGPVPPDAVARAKALVQEADLEYFMKEIPQALAQSLQGVEHVAGIVLAMKEFSHPGGDERQAIDLNRAIDGTITVARNEWKYVADVETDLDPSLGTVAGVRGDLNQVLLNLIVNAAHAIEDAQGGSGAKGRITISTRQVGDWAELRVADSGTGIPEEIRDRVFDPFFTTKPVGRGTGQGLAIVYDVVTRKHGGTVTFETESGKGTVFVVRLPRTPAAVAV